jgi:Tfp pilus assembly PilM family ATPase
MFRNIFLPERIGSYFIFKTRIGAFEFTPSTIICSVVTHSGTHKHIDLFLEEALSQDQSIAAGERIGIALKSIIEKVGALDHSIAILPGNNAVIKETTVPFLDPEKIRLVAPYEIEGSIPFDLSDAIFDAQQLNTHEEGSRALVAAVRTSAYRDYDDAFAYAEISPDRVTIDLVELIPLARSLAAAHHAVVSIICDMGLHSSRIISVVGNAVRLIRWVPQGTSHAGQSFEGLNDTVAEELLFTFEAARLGKPHNECIVHLSGLGAEDTTITDLLAEQTGMAVERVSPRKIIGSPTPITARYTTTLEAARQGTEGLSLDKAREEEKIGRIRANQAFVALIISGISCILLITYSIIIVRGMSGEAYESEQETLERLRKAFALSARNSSSLEQATANAERELSKEEAIWFALSSRNRFSFLSYLQELSRKIDRNALGLEIKRFVMRIGDGGGDDTLTIEGSVRDYDALRTLEEALIKSALFRVVPKLQETQFTISLVIDKKGGDND